VPPDLTRDQRHPPGGVVVAHLLEGSLDVPLQRRLVAGRRDRHEVRAQVEVARHRLDPDGRFRGRGGEEGRATKGGQDQQ
jgi:hypothetical protein